MVVKVSPQELYGRLKFPTGSTWWLWILNRICMVLGILILIFLVVRDSSQDLHGG